MARRGGSGNGWGVKGERSLASPNPHRGFGLARDGLGGFFGGSATKVGAVRGQQDGAGDAGCAEVARGWGGGVSTGRGGVQADSETW